VRRKQRLREKVLSEFVSLGSPPAPGSYHFCNCCVKNKRGTIRLMKHCQTTLAILAALFASIALAEDFKTIDGKEYKNVTVSRVEPDGIMLKSKSGISKVYFTELPREIQERFHYNPANAAAQPVEQNANLTARSSQRADVTPNATEPMAKSGIETFAPANRAGCLDIATAKPALDNAAARLDASVEAAKRGSTTTAASEVRSAAASLRTAASALSADAAISQFDMRAAEAYDKAAAAYANGDENSAALYAAAANGFVKTSTDALRHSSVPRCH
jgi:hypothetical protein